MRSLFPHRSGRWSAAPLFLLTAWTAVTGGRAAAQPLLPDLVSTADEQRGFMYGGTFDTTFEPGRVLYRFDTAITNLGDGPFQLFETTDAVAQTQDVFQDVFDSAGGFTRTPIVSFSNVEPTPFGHLHLERLALYKLREITADNGVGDVIASYAKTSHAVVDSVAIDTSLPAAPASPVYNSALANPLGISVGYADLYGRHIPKQRIDLTGIASGAYWLEVTVDPDGVVIESDTTNNTTRILVDLTIPAGAPTVPGDYDGNGLVSQSDLDLVLLNWGDDVNLVGGPNDWINDRPSGLISQNELDGVLLNWGNGTPPESTAIPEPGSLAWLALSGLCCRRRRTSR